MGEKFGTFKEFLIRNDDNIDRKRKPQLERIIKEHYDKFGSSSDEESIEVNPKVKNDTINIQVSKH